MRIRKRLPPKSADDAAASACIEQPSAIVINTGDFSQGRFPFERIDHARASSPSKKEGLVGTHYSSAHSMQATGARHSKRDALLLQDHRERHRRHQLQALKEHSPAHENGDLVEKDGCDAERITAKFVSTVAQRHKTVLKPLQVADSNAGGTSMQHENPATLLSASHLSSAEPAAVDLCHEKVLESTRTLSAICLDKHNITSSYPLVKVDNNRNLTIEKEFTTRVVKDEIVPTRKDTTFCDIENVASINFTHFSSGMVNVDSKAQTIIFKSVQPNSDSLLCRENLKGSDCSSELQPLRCSWKGGQGGQCKNKRAEDGFSIYCDYHRSKPRASWDICKKNSREAQQGSSPDNVMVDANMLELPLFPCAFALHGNALQDGSILKRRPPQKESNTEDQQAFGAVCPDDLELRLAPKYVSLPSLVDTDMRSDQPKRMESSAYHSLVFDKRKIESVPTLGETQMAVTSYNRSELLEVSTIFTDLQHAKTIPVPGCISLIQQDNGTGGKCWSTKVDIGNDNAEVLNTQTVYEQKGLYAKSWRAKSEQIIKDDIIHLKKISSGMYDLQVENLAKTAIREHFLEDEQEQGFLEQQQQHQNRCNRHHTRGWQCKRVCLPGKSHCKHHVERQRCVSSSNIKTGGQPLFLAQPQQVDSIIVNVVAAGNVCSRLVEPLHQNCCQVTCVELNEANIAAGAGCTAIELKNHDGMKVEYENKGEQAIFSQNRQDEDKKSQDLRTKIVKPEPQEEKMCGERQNAAHLAEKDARWTGFAPEKRCRRHDGRGWQCKSECVAGSAYCEHHKENLRRNRIGWSSGSATVKQRSTRRRQCAQQQQRSRRMQQDTASCAIRKAQKPNGDKEEDEDGSWEENSSSSSNGRSGSRGAQQPPLEQQVDDDAGGALHNDVVIGKAVPSTTGKRKRKSLQHIYARCSA